ncbi:hypothetical protein GQ600_27092 [Phytophthora cactorum]|nr:hypothetical protein GQ600_27092 [Phytophthora cactorum]
MLDELRRLASSVRYPHFYQVYAAHSLCCYSDLLKQYYRELDSNAAWNPHRWASSESKLYQKFVEVASASSSPRRPSSVCWIHAGLRSPVTARMVVVQTAAESEALPRAKLRATILHLPSKRTRNPAQTDKTVAMLWSARYFAVVAGEVPSSKLAFQFLGSGFPLDNILSTLVQT